MATAIDSAGRLVIPKAVRDAAGIQPGAPLEVRFRDGRIEIEQIDAHIAACATKAGAARLATFNRCHFERLELGDVVLLVPPAE